MYKNIPLNRALLIAMLISPLCEGEPKAAFQTDGSDIESSFYVVDNNGVTESDTESSGSYSDDTESNSDSGEESSYTPSDEDDDDFGSDKPNPETKGNDHATKVPTVHSHTNRNIIITAVVVAVGAHVYYRYIAPHIAKYVRTMKDGNTKRLLMKLSWANNKKK